MMAYFMQDEFPEADIDKVIKMCIFHEIFLRLRKLLLIQSMKIL